MVSALVSRVMIIVGGTLYPAYYSYKTVKNKDVREYVKWMMYWIVFACYLTVEIFADTFLSWAPFYYELKMLFVLWLAAPYTRGASILYRKFLHPTLKKHEEVIDQYMDKAKSESYTTILRLGGQGINYAREVVATAAVQGMTHIHKSYSMTDVSREEVTYQGRGAVPAGGGVRRRVVGIAELEEEDVVDGEGEVEEGMEMREERVWEGFYDNDGHLVEAEAELEGSEMGEDGRPLRRSHRRRKQPEHYLDGYATLPRPSSRNRRTTKVS